MDENYKIINEFVNKYKDTLVIDFDKIKVLRNFINGEDDYYYLLQTLRGDFEQTSCVGEIVPLKGFIEEDSYNRLKYSFQSNLKKLNKEIK